MKAYCKGCPVLDTSFFSALKGPAKEMILCLFVYGKYRRQQVLFQEGNPSTRVFALKSGLIKTYKTSADGRVQLIELVRPGDVFGLEGLSSKEYSVTAEVLAEAEVCFFETSRFAELLRGNPDLSRGEVADLIGTRLETVSRLLDSFKRRRIVSIRGNKVRVLDLERLKSTAA